MMCGCMCVRACACISTAVADWSECPLHTW